MNDISTKIQILFSRLYLSSVKSYTTKVHSPMVINYNSYIKLNEKNVFSSFSEFHPVTYDMNFNIYTII